jgi:hypothetical protein
MLYILFWTLACLLPAHDYHSSIAEVRYQAKKQTIEVELHIFTDDLELALKKKLGTKVVLDNSKKYQTDIADYVLAYFQIKNTKKQAVVGKFIGKETDFEKHIVYIEFPAKSFSEKWTLRNSLMTDMYDDQFNIVNFFYNDESRARKTLAFRRGSEWDTFQ